VKKFVSLALALGMIAAIGCSGSTSSSVSKQSTTTTTTTEKKAEPK